MVQVENVLQTVVADFFLGIGQGKNVQLIMVESLQLITIQVEQASLGVVAEQGLHGHDELHLIRPGLHVQIRLLPVEFLPALHDLVHSAASLLCIAKEGEHRLKILVAADALVAMVVLGRSDEQDAGIGEDDLVGILIDGHRGILQIVGMHTEVCEGLPDSDMCQGLIDALVTSQLEWFG